MKKSHRLFSQSTLYILYIIVGYRIYKANVDSTQLLVDLVLVFLLALIQTHFGSRHRATRTMKMRAPNRSDFWRDLLALTDEVDYAPSCQMDDLYFFRQDWGGITYQITLKKLAEDHWEIEFPSLIAKPVESRLGVYKKIGELTPGAAH